MGRQLESSESEPVAAISRRQLVGLGAAGAAGVVIAKVASPGSALAAKTGLGGVHVNVVTNQVSPPPPTDGFIHTFVLTLWGPDHALSGMGCGYTEGNA